MEKNVVVSIKGIQTNLENGTSTLEMMSEARFFKKDNNYYIVYKESEITGMEGTTTTIKICKDSVSLIRFGTISTNFLFEVGKKNLSNYGTMYGSMEISIYAKKITSTIDENGGELYIEYEVEIGGEKFGYNNFFVKILDNN